MNIIGSELRTTEIDQNIVLKKIFRNEKITIFRQKLSRFYANFRRTDSKAKIKFKMQKILATIQNEHQKLWNKKSSQQKKVCGCEK